MPSSQTALVACYRLVLQEAYGSDFTSCVVSRDTSRTDTSGRNLAHGHYTEAVVDRAV